MRSTRARVADGVDDDVDVDDGSAAITAAEIVAAALGLGNDRVPEAALARVASHRADVTAEDGALARRALERALGEGSELRELWEESGSDAPWHADVAVLVRRLGGDPGALAAGAMRAKGQAGRAGNDPRASRREKQVLLTFLVVRGLVATDEQVARIEACTDAAQLRRWLSRVVTAPNVAAVLGAPDTSPWKSRADQ